MAFKKHKDDQENTEVQPVEVQGEDRPDAEPADDRGDASRAEDDPKRVVNNGDVSDPGNSGLIGEAFTEGSVTGQADKPNG